VVLLLKRDGPCDIHLIHDNLIKQPLFRPRKRELTSRKKVLPTLALSAIDTHTHTQAHTLDRQDPEAGNTQVLSSTCAVGWASSLTLAVQLSHPPGRGLTGKRRLTDDRFYLFFKRREREPLRATPLPIQQTHTGPPSSCIFSKVAKMSSHRWTGCWWIVKRVTYIVNEVHVTGLPSPQLPWRAAGVSREPSWLDPTLRRHHPP